MNGKRCAIWLSLSIHGPLYVAKYNAVNCTTNVNIHRHVRLFGSHSEAKRELAKWLPEWPDAKIVDEVEL
jgi:hypothetical protein